MKKALYVLITAVLLSGIISCGKKYELRRSADVESEQMVFKFAESSSGLKNGLYEDLNLNLDFLDDSKPVVNERKLIRTANLRVQVKSFEGLDLSLTDVVNKFGGYISNSSSSEYDNSYTVRIPQEKFDEFLSLIGDFGKVLSKNINARDVTEEYYDTQARLETKKILREKYEEYLKKAKDVKELLEVEKQLNDVQYEIDSAEGRLKYLDNKVNYSTISISFELPPNVSSSGFVKPNVKEKFSDFASAVLEFFASFAVFICYLVVFGVPIIALIALLFWLCFGKLGLLRKLYDKLKK